MSGICSKHQGHDSTCRLCAAGPGPTAPASKGEDAREKIHRAHKVVSDICNGRQKWTMQIPARPSEDSDLIIGAALRAADDLLAENRALRKETEELRAQVGAYEEADRIFTADFDAATLVKDGVMLMDENANLKTKIEDLAWTKAEAVARLRGEVADLKAQVWKQWTCPGCAFSFSTDHIDEKTGGYSCPLCAEARLEAQVEALRQGIAVKDGEVSILRAQLSAGREREKGLVKALEAAASAASGEARRLRIPWKDKPHDHVKLRAWTALGERLDSALAAYREK